MPTLVQRKLIGPLKALLLHGITPRKLALSLACGILLGVFPVLGTTTLLCTLLALGLRLNLPAIQLANYAVYPLHLAMLLPFIRAGEWITGAERTRMSLHEIVTLVKADQLGAVRLLWRVALQAVIAWAVFSVIVMPLLYWILHRLMERLDRYIRQRRTPAPL